MLGFFIKLLIYLSLAGTVFGFVLSATARHSVWISIGIYAVVMLILFLCSHFRVGYVGGSDAMGNGMEAGFLLLFYYASMIAASIAFLVSLALWYFKYRHGA